MLRLYQSYQKRRKDLGTEEIFCERSGIKNMFLLSCENYLCIYLLNRTYKFLNVVLLKRIVKECKDFLNVFADHRPIWVSDLSASLITGPIWVSAISAPLLLESLIIITSNADLTIGNAFWFCCDVCVYKITTRC